MLDTHPATKWRNDVAIGVSRWNRIPTAPLVPKGRQEFQRAQLMSPFRGLVNVAIHITTGSHPRLQHAVPSGLAY